MDRFLDEMENQANNRDRPTSPINSLLFTDHKRQSPSAHSPVKTPTQEELAEVVELMANAPIEFATTLRELAPDLAAAAAVSAAAAGRLAESPPLTSSTPLKTPASSVASPVQQPVPLDAGAAGDALTRTAEPSDTSDEPVAKRLKLSSSGDAPASDVAPDEAAEAATSSSADPRTDSSVKTPECRVHKHQPDSAGDHVDVPLSKPKHDLDCSPASCNGVKPDEAEVATNSDSAQLVCEQVHPT